MEDIDLIEKAIEAKEMAYAPYSNFKVGAALLTTSGKIFFGCNIENSSYGATICAERVAIVKAVSEGYLKFTKIAIIADTDEIIRPCGICLQFIAEFGIDIEILMSNKSKIYEKSYLKNLLPKIFYFDKK